MLLNIATGKSASSSIWKNEKISWQELVNRLSQTIHTNETLKEYLACNKEDQGAIKDVGGYVGGYLRNGRRSKSTITYRQLLTLDIDFATLDFWDDFTLWYAEAAVLHSTHKHSNDNPRLRLIMPLDREVNKEEYEAIARYVAGDLGIELFDNTTFQPSRLMFWPSTPKDQDYYFKSQSGPILSADKVLSYYSDWRDVSLWPTSQKHTKYIINRADKQEDPEEKKGIIGVFCRAYTIEEVIEKYLGEVYKPTDNGRFTYVKGSTSGGLVPYENKFVYSHHGTDPISGMLCNAFDLVRIHKFGDTIASKKETEQLVLQDLKVKRLLAEERINSANFAFADNLQPVEEDRTDWAKDLEVDSRGKYLSTAYNVNTILQQDPELRKKFKLNEFDQKRYLSKSVPWRLIIKPEPMKNIDYSGVRNYIETIYGIAGNLKIDDSLAIEIEKNKFNPVKDYLKSVKWDGQNRIDHLLTEYFGVEETRYTREAMAVMLIGAISRIFNPGCKFDLMLVLVGRKEGTGKSTFIRKLGKDWFSDTFTTVHGKEAFEQIQGAWLIEMAELSGIRKAEVEAVKHFITKQVDQFRPAYGRVSETYKRQCVFFGTTNDDKFLKIQGDNRRFMPVAVKEDEATKDPLSDELDNEVDQVWAEAMILYRQGVQPYLSKEANELANKARAQHVEVDERAGIIENYLDKLLPEDWHKMDIFERRMFVNDKNSEGAEQREFVCIAEVWCECLQKDRQDMDRYKTRDINEIMKGLKDWQYVNSTKDFELYGKQKFYKRIKHEKSNN